jgi:hypothetical protein
VSKHLVLTRAGAVRPSAVTKTHAAAMLDMSVQSFRRHVLPDLKVVRIGELTLVPTAELDCWLDENATPAVAEFGR